MTIKGLTDEDFINYKKPSMFIATSYCSFKCEKECGVRCCQNSALVKQPVLGINNYYIADRYVNNPITSAIVFGGLEPLDQVDELREFLGVLRGTFKCDDDVVIYTGYTEDEAKPNIDTLKEYKNIIVKYGRYIPGSEKHFDDIVGVNLSSPNQYAVKIS